MNCMPPAEKPEPKLIVAVVPPLGVTVNEVPDECVSVPLVAVTVSGYVPAGVVAAVETVIAVEPVPVTVVGLKPTVAPVGSPLTLNDTTPVKPFAGVIIAVYGAFDPCTTDCVPGVTPSEKSGVGAVVTVTEVLAECVSVPLVAVTVNGKVPAGVVEAVDTVIVVEPLPFTVAGLKAAVAFVGNPVTLNDTAPVKPFAGVIVAVYGVFEPCTTDCEAGVTPSEKSGVGVLVPELNVQFRISWVAVCPPVPPVNPTNAVFAPTVAGMLIGNDVVNVFAGTVRSEIVMLRFVPS